MDIKERQQHGKWLLLIWISIDHAQKLNFETQIFKIEKNNLKNNDYQNQLNKFIKKIKQTQTINKQNNQLTNI